MSCAVGDLLNTSACHFFLAPKSAVRLVVCAILITWERDWYSVCVCECGTCLV